MRTPILMTALALALAGCGAQSLAPTAQRAAGALQARASEALFPADPSSVWQYEVTAHPVDDPYVDYKGTETVTVDSVRRQNGRTVLQLRAIDDFTDRYRFPVVTEGPEGVSLQGVTYWGTAASSAEELKIEFLRFPLKPGGRSDDGLWISEVKRKETVKVPAGTFEAWRVSVIGTYEAQYTAVGTYWVAPGRGIVKSDLNIPGWNIESEMIPAGAPVKRRAMPKGLKFGR